MIPHQLSDLTAGQRISNWLILGPFVVRTSDHFEREYMYERERVLDIDYLAEDGGEAAIVPEIGMSHANIGLGPKRLAWRELTDEWLRGTRIAGEIIYETVQRNCVIYAATLVDSDVDCSALLDAYHSGAKVWANGELICNMPYGLPKGVRSTMPSTAFRLRKGLNLLLFKFRPGYICDGIDFCIGDVRVSPLKSTGKLPIALGRIRPLPFFRGTQDNPRQVIEAAVLNTSNVSNSVRMSCISEDLGAEDVEEVLCEPQRVTRVRLSLATPREAAGKPVKAVFRARLYGETLEVPFEYETAPAPKHDGTVFVLSSFHFDTTYHEEQRVYAMGAFDIVRQYCRLHRTDPLFRSIISEVDYLKPYFDVYPEDRETLMRVFREKKSEPDVMYNQPNEQNCGDEALVRNFLYGQLIHGRVFGNICHVYGPGDVFGHPNQLSQIARKSGCIGLTWDKHIFNFPPFFDHLALDGVGIPHKRGEASEDDVHAMGLSVRTGGIEQTPPTSWHHTLMPVYKQGTYEDLIGSILRGCEDKQARLPVTTRDMSLYHAATAVSRVDLKIANRLGENRLLDAEKLATLAALFGAKYPEKALDKAWRQLLCGQHHDSITGTHNEISFVDLMNSYREALELGTDVLDRSVAYLGQAVDARMTKESKPHIVFNSMAWERTDTVCAKIENLGGKGFTLHDASGKNVPFDVLSVQPDAKGRPQSADIVFVAKGVPSLGYRTYRVQSSTSELTPRKKTEETNIENEFYRIEVDALRGGGIVSVYDKEAKREVIDATRHVGNELAILQEVPERDETQHEFYTTGLKMFSGDSPASVEVEKGSVSATLRARYSMGELCDVVQEITLHRGVKRIEFRTILLDVQREDYLYAVTFPTNLKGLVPVFDERFGAVARNESRDYLDFRTHQMVMFSDCAVYAANKWMEYGGTAWVQAGRSKYALSMVGLVTPNDPAITCVKENLQRAFIQKGVTCTPWNDKDGPHWGSYLNHMDHDLSYTRFRVSIGIKGNNAYSGKLLKTVPAAARKAFAQRAKSTGLACMLVKDSDLKDKKWPALPILVVEGASEEQLAAGVESILAGFERTSVIKLAAECDATGESHKVDDYGVALLNRGTYANSIEKGGTLCMILGHTCRWYGGTNNFREGYLVPENKNHVYTYALYPHGGTWRDAGTHRAAHAFNHPMLFRKIKTAPKPCLPPEMSFLKIEPANVILTAMKPWGNPLASFQRGQTPDPTSGIMLRFYESEGTDSEVWLTFAGGVAEAWSGNMLEENERELPVAGTVLAVPAGPFCIETVGFRPGSFGRSFDAKLLGAEAEPVQPVWVRSWEHDAESMPMGYHTVVCSISREVVEEDDGRVLKIKVHTVNDYTDSEVSGKADLLLPDGWTADRTGIAYRLAPLSFQADIVTVHRPDPSVSGQIKLRHVFDGQVFQDVLEIGGAFNLQMHARNDGNTITVTVNNPTNETVDGEVSIVTPIETWPGSLVGSFAISDISPRTQGISLAPGQSAELAFSVSFRENRDLVPQDSYWAVAKLMSNGRIQLRRCDLRPEGRRMWAKRWRDRYWAAQGNPQDSPEY